MIRYIFEFLQYFMNKMLNMVSITPAKHQHVSIVIVSMLHHFAKMQQILEYLRYFNMDIVYILKVHIVFYV